MSLYHGFDPDNTGAGPSYPYNPPPAPAEIAVPVVYMNLPKDFTLQPAWVTSDGMRQDCMATLNDFPTQGELKSIRHPLAASRGRCMVGIYFSEPKPNGDPTVEEQWANLFTWTAAGIDLYLAFSATGFSLNFDSGLQITVFEPSAVDIDPKRLGRKLWIMESLEYVINDTLSGNRGRSRGRGRGRAGPRSPACR